MNFAWCIPGDCSSDDDGRHPCRQVRRAAAAAAAATATGIRTGMHMQETPGWFRTGTEGRHGGLESRRGASS